MAENTDYILGMIQDLQGRLSSIEASVAASDDDIPESGDIIIVEEGGGSDGYWSGRAFDFYDYASITPIDLTDADNILGTHICYHTGETTGAPVDGTVISGRWYWALEVQDRPYLSWEVAEEIPDTSPTEYRLVSGKTVGDIHVPVPIPTNKYEVMQVGKDGESDDGMIFDHLRAIL